MDHEIQPAERAVDFLEDARDLAVVGHVERKNQGIGEAFGKVADILLEPLPLEGQRHSRAGVRRRLRDRP